VDRLRDYPATTLKVTREIGRTILAASDDAIARQ